MGNRVTRKHGENNQDKRKEGSKTDTRYEKKTVARTRVIKMSLSIIKYEKKKLNSNTEKPKHKSKTHIC